jgi:hypothetical protein
MTLAVTFLAVCVTYLAAFGIGWYLSARGQLVPDQLFQARHLVDPFTARFQRWHDKTKMNALRQKHWVQLGVLLAANNLCAVAFVSRTLYGVTLVLPAYFTYRQGFTQGALVARSSMRMPGPFVGVAVLEFGAYLLATVLGVNVVIAVAVGTSFVQAMQSLVIFYPIVVSAICAGAWLEVRWLRGQMQEVSFPAEVNMEELRAKALDVIKREWTVGQHNPPLQPPSGAGKS